MVIGSRTDVSAGDLKVVTNMITSNPYLYVKYDAGTRRYYPSNTYSGGNTTGVGMVTGVSVNEDTYPFKTYASNPATERNYNFNGDSRDQFYLLGYYKTDEKFYDLRIQASDTEKLY